MDNKKRFLQTINQDDVDLANGALLIARHFRPHLDLDYQLGLIDNLAADAMLSQVSDPATLVEFFSAKGFHGNNDDYYHKDNSLLDQVLVNKKGIPITLAIVYLSVIERLTATEMTANGVSFPGHFLLSVNQQNNQYLIDVFEARQVTQQACYDRAAAHGLQPDPAYFQPATNQDILCRLIENLKVIHWKASDFTTVLDCLDYQLMIFPQRTRLLEQQHELRLMSNNGNSDHSGTTQLH